MSGHPYKGKRSNWFSLLDRPPTLVGWYEYSCVVIGVECEAAKVDEEGLMSFYGTSVHVLKRLFGHQPKPCSFCIWRGLAEKPE